ncbi:Holliday junction DNA helicase RuvA [Spiroplasma diminutum]|uniref:Holliday junction DNA helicase RuvA n=1 Tax=Spiroplasma diminutum CUAS-1 TaxID=1276221 RepID=S5MJF0_9MOLU|nr:Holliday junction DNA helicase RuvA [Spiroplasma diminutum]AGR42105.1 Holliday junction DNA helicase RuvA [Spiroplasma diminutum CUAS-1]
MYYLKCKILEESDIYLIVESNNIGYKGYKIFKENLDIDKEQFLYLINYKNEFSNELLFFNSKETRDISEIILSIKNIGITSIKKIFTILSIEEFKDICKNQDINKLLEKTKLTEINCKKIIQEIRSKVFKQKYNLKQMNIINSLNKLGYKLSDIYKVFNQIDLNLNEELILENAIFNLNYNGN